MKNIKYCFLILTLIIFSCKQKLNNEQKAITEIKEPEKLDKFDLAQKYQFEDFTTDIYKGILALPDFKNAPYADDKEFIDLISKGCKKIPINFAGHFTVLTKSCGMYCEHLFLIDRRNGKIRIINFPNEATYGFQYQANSNLFIINSNSLDENLTSKEQFEMFPPEYYIWENDNFKRLK